MKTITNGVIFATIPTGALPIYESQGWKEVKGGGDAQAPIPAPESSPVRASKPVKVEEPMVAEVKEEVVEENRFADLMEKPISQWTKSEIKTFAEENGVDLNGVKSFTDAKNKVKDFIEKM